MTSATNLMPCPFCAHSDITIKNQKPEDNSGGYYIECPGCGAGTSLRYACGDDHATPLAEQWNCRAQTAPCLHQITEPGATAQQPYAVLVREIGESSFFDGKPVKPGSAQHRAAMISPELDYVVLYADPSPAVLTYPDDAAVDALAALMKSKLAKQRAKGYAGWDTDCTQQRLSDLLRGHVDKGDPVDVANFCAFLSARGEGIAAAPQAALAAVPVAIEQMAVDRYKVVPSHESMFHRWAVVSGNGTQQLYIGREVECQNMALKFTGAFLDGAFVAMQNTATAHPAEGVPADPMDWPLPCDVTVGHGTMRKGVKLSTLVLRMKALYQMATGNDADEAAARTPEQRAQLLAEVQARIGASPAGVPAAAPDERDVQWWLASIDQHGNPTLSDGAHSDRAGADKAAYLIDAMGLGAGRKFAVARVELSEPKPSSDGVNHEAVALHNRAAQAGKGVQ